jgi:hypothetical protein
MLDAERKNIEPIKDYDLGAKRNWISVFGPMWYCNIFPITNAPMTSDGTVWMKRGAIGDLGLIEGEIGED